MDKIIIFGLKENSEIANYYLEIDSPYKPVAFCVHEEYIKESIFNGLPVVGFENIQKEFPSKDYKFIAPLAPSKMNQVREGVYNQIQSKGYDFISYISSKANVYSERIGKNCFILEGNTIQPFVSIGNNVLMWSGNHIGHHSHIEDHVTFTSQVVLSGRCHVGSNCFFGVNSSIRDGVVIAQGTFVSMGSIVTSNTKEWSVYKSDEAKLVNIPSTRVKF